MTRVPIIIILFLLFTSCARVIIIESKFDVEEGEWIANKGQGEVSGEAFMTTIGGDVKSCAGQEIRLQPVTKYGKERIEKIYGNVDGGMLHVMAKHEITEAPKDYITQSILKKCDSGGKFSFKDLPSGDYYIVGRVMWASSINQYYTKWEGATFVKRFSLADGQKIELILP